MEELTQFFTYERPGTLWEGRSKSMLAYAENYLLTAFRYIDLNPVRAHMVVHVSEYRWSSFQGNTMGEAS